MEKAEATVAESLKQAHEALLDRDLDQAVCLSAGERLHEDGEET